MSLQVVDKNNPEYAELMKISKELSVLEKDTKVLRADKDNVTTQIQRLMQLVDSPDAKNYTMEKLLEIQESTGKVCQEHDATSKGIDHALERLCILELKQQKHLQFIRDVLRKNTDKLSDDVKDKLSVSSRFLKPVGLVSDSVQRPEKLKDLLDSSTLHSEDKDYKQYKEYVNLVQDNLAKCNYATNDLTQLERDVTPAIDEYHRSLTKDMQIVPQIDNLQNSYK